MEEELTKLEVMLSQTREEQQQTTASDEEITQLREQQTAKDEENTLLRKEKAWLNKHLSSAKEQLVSEVGKRAI